MKKGYFAICLEKDEVVYEDEKILYMPVELSNILSSIDGAELAYVLRRNTEWVSLTLGMLYYYGVAGTDFVTKRIEALTGEEVDFREFLEVISIACDFYKQVKFSAYGLQDHRVFNARYVVEQQKMVAARNTKSVAAGKNTEAFPANL